MATLNVNGKPMMFEAEADTPLLWVLREQLGLTGTKYGCGIAQCGSCTVHIDGAPVRSCALPLAALNPNQKIVTIEGLSADGSHPVQTGLGCAGRAAMRLLPVRHDHGGCGAAGLEPEAQRCRHRCGDEQHLPLRHLQPRACRHQASRCCDAQLRRPP